MTTLHDRLADLADEAPIGVPAPDLWTRGVRVHRVRRAGTLAIITTAVVLLAVVAAVDWQRSAPVPAPAYGSVGLPDRVWSPSPWLPSTQQPGQLVAVSGAEQATWTGTHPAVVGISASTGGYAFLDLPGADLENGAVELAPDGRHIAYWLTGPTTGTPNSESGPVTGVGVYDAVTGSVTRHWIDTAHGLMPDFLTWADAGTVVFSAGQIRGGDDASGMDRSSSTFGTVTSWALVGEPQPVAGVAPGASLEGAGHGRILVDGPSSRQDRHVLVDVADPTHPRDLEIPRLTGAFGHMHFVALDATGRRIALVPAATTPNVAQAGVAGHLHEVPGTERTFGVVDWIDSHSIVTLGRLGRMSVALRVALYRVDVSTGESRMIVRFPVDSLGGGWQFATDLLDAPSVAGVEPPSPVDPRATAGLTVAVCLAAGLALVLWRRRVRA
jgi:hypothetical protein